MKPDNRSENVQIVDFKPTRVGVLEHRGDPALLENTIRRSSAGAGRTTCTPG